jgi:hypothetical protein
MDSRDLVGNAQPDPQRPLGYEPPRVERVLGPMELEREALYAGDNATPAAGG